MKAKKLSIYLDPASSALMNELIEEGETTSAFLQRMIREAAKARGFSVKVGIWHDGKLIKEM